MSIISENIDKDYKYLLERKSHEALYHLIIKKIGSDLGAFFSKPNRQLGKTIYTVEMDAMVSRKSIRSFDRLSPEEQHEACDLLEENKFLITQALSGVSELKNILDDLFKVPSTDDIKVFEWEGFTRVVIAKWGWTSLNGERDFNPVSELIERDRPNRTRVVLEVNHPDGSKARNFDFLLNYRGRIRKYRTDDQGNCDLGRFKHGAEMTAYLDVKGESQFVQELVVGEGLSYQATFPMFIDARVRFTDQLGNPLPNVHATIEVNGQPKPGLTDSLGQINLSQLEVGQQIKVCEKGKEEDAEVFYVEANSREFIVECFRPQIRQQKLKVVDKSGMGVSGKEIIATQSSSTHSYTSDESGMILLENIQEGETFVLQEKGRDDNRMSCTVDPESTELLIFEINTAARKQIGVKVMSLLQRARTDVELELRRNGEVLIEGKTNADGSLLLPRDLLVSGDQVQVQIKRTPASYLEGLANGLLPRRFNFVPAKDLYRLYLIHIPRWWPLLLLPLIFFLRFDVSLKVKTLASTQTDPLVNLRISLNYPKPTAVPWKTVNETVPGEIAADGVKFNDLKYSPYTYLFAGMSEAEIKSISECYDGIYATNLKALREDGIPDLNMSPSITNLDFRAVYQDIQAGAEPEGVEGVQVSVEAVFNGQRFIDSAKTGKNGRVILSGLPKCGKIIRATARRDGLASSSILGLDTLSVLQHAASGSLDFSRTFVMKPQLVLLVKNETTGLPIPGAKVSLYFEEGNWSIKSRANGEGKVIINNAKINDKFSISIRATSEYEGADKTGLLVKDFINMNEKDRTLLLTPKSNPTIYRFSPTPTTHKP